MARRSVHGHRTVWEQRLCGIEWDKFLDGLRQVAQHNTSRGAELIASMVICKYHWLGVPIATIMNKDERDPQTPGRRSLAAVVMYVCGREPPGMRVVGAFDVVRRMLPGRTVQKFSRNACSFLLSGGARPAGSYYPASRTCNRLCCFSRFRDGDSTGFQSHSDSE